MKKFFLAFITLFIFGCCAKNTNTSVNQDLLFGSWIEPIPFDSTQMQGIEIKANGEAKSINMNTLKWKSWKCSGDTLFLTGSSLGNGENFDFTDTVKIQTLTNDSLILSNGIQYNKKR